MALQTNGVRNVLGWANHRTRQGIHADDKL